MKQFEENAANPASPKEETKKQQKTTPTERLKLKGFLNDTEPSQQQQPQPQQLADPTKDSPTKGSIDNNAKNPAIKESTELNQKGVNISIK